MYKVILKKLAIFQLIIISVFSSVVFSFEIQCNTNIDDLDIVLKKSPSSNITYILSFKKNDEVVPLIINEDLIVNTEHYFSYRSSDISIEVDKDKGVGELYLSSFNHVKLFDCEEF